MQTFSTRWQQFTSKFQYHCFTPDSFCLVWNSGGWWLLRVVVYIFPWQFKDCWFLLKGHIIPRKQHRMTLLTANWSHIHCCKLPFVLVLHVLICVTSSVVLLLPQLGWRHKCTVVLVFTTVQKTLLKKTSCFDFFGSEPTLFHFPTGNITTCSGQSFWEGLKVATLIFGLW